MVVKALAPGVDTTARLFLAWSSSCGLLLAAPSRRQAATNHHHPPRPPPPTTHQHDSQALPPHPHDAAGGRRPAGQPADRGGHRRPTHGAYDALVSFECQCVVIGVVFLLLKGARHGGKGGRTTWLQFLRHGLRGGSASMRLDDDSLPLFFLPSFFQYTAYGTTTVTATAY